LEEPQSWIDAIIRFFDDPDADIACPSCARENLKVMDIRVESAPGLYERIIYCPACGEKSTIRCREKRSK
jgi:predicted RNA-binding Zn-ribbon protein involved in translation (DUF1610 family)